MISRIVSTVSVDFILVNPFCSAIALMIWDLVRVLSGCILHLEGLTIKDLLLFSSYNDICQENNRLHEWEELCYFLTFKLITVTINLIA